MRIAHLPKWLLLGITMAFVAGCSTTKGTGSEVVDGGQGEQVGQDAQAAGLGEDVSLTGEERYDNATLRAPYNQTYLFDYDKSDIHEQDIPSVNAQATYLVAHPSAKVVIEGHTDSRGSREYNIALGERRAKSVANVLMLKGVQKAQIRVVSYGAERPVALGSTDAAYRLNRRANLVYEAK